MLLLQLLEVYQKSEPLRVVVLVQVLYVRSSGDTDNAQSFLVRLGATQQFTEQINFFTDMMASALGSEAQTAEKSTSSVIITVNDHTGGWVVKSVCVKINR